MGGSFSGWGWGDQGRSSWPSGRGAEARTEATCSTRSWMRLNCSLTVMARFPTPAKYVEFGEMELSPKPVQRPLPIYMAAHGEASLRRTAKYGLGPMVRDPETPEVLEALAPMLEENGRTISDIDFCVWA